MLTRRSGGGCVGDGGTDRGSSDLFQKEELEVARRAVVNAVRFAT